MPILADLFEHLANKSPRDKFEAGDCAALPPEHDGGAAKQEDIPTKGVAVLLSSIP